ncbi:MAG TPA: DUF302 domain-containing protein [Hanamia sp.]|nr:DUF302 domain-containing protein [Hanamia sp.]
MNGLITIQSAYPVSKTIDRLISIIESRGMTIFGRIDHADNALKQGLPLRPTELIIFGNPKAGTLLMQDKQISGIDLPLKALAWEDIQGKTWLTYNDINWIAERHGLSKEMNSIIKAIADGITSVALNATTIEK